MKHVISIILKLAFAFALLTFYSHAADPQPADDLKSIEGKWTFQSGSKDGQAAPQVKGGLGVLIFAGTTVTIMPTGAPAGLDMKFTLDATTTPRRITLEPIKPGAAGGLGNGVYELNGDTLRMAFGRGADFPTELSDKGLTLYVFKKDAVGAPASPATK